MSECLPARAHVGTENVGDSPGRGNHESPVAHSAFTHLLRVSIRPGALQFNCSTTKRPAGVDAFTSTRQTHMRKATPLPHQWSWRSRRLRSRRHHRSHHRRRSRRHHTRNRRHSRRPRGAHRRGAHRPGSNRRHRRPTSRRRPRRPSSGRGRSRNPVRRRRPARPGPPGRSLPRRPPGKSRSPSASHSFLPPKRGTRSVRRPVRRSGAVPRRGRPRRRPSASFVRG